MTAATHSDGVRPRGAGSGHKRFVLWPHRSLGSRNTIILFAVVATGLAIPFVLISGAQAWPLIVAAVATFAILAVAFRSNNRAARFHEVIEVSTHTLQVERVGPACAYKCFKFNPHWVRLIVETDHYVENRITLNESGRTCTIGEFLAPEERESLAESLRERLGFAYVSE